MRYKTDLTESIIKSNMAAEMLNIISPLYGDDYVSLWLFQVIGSQIDKAFNLGDEFILQVVPNTATWTLPYWESEYGLPSNSDWTTDTEKRRQAIISKMWSNGAMNPAKLEKELTAICGAEVKIAERTGKRRFSVFIASRPYLTDEQAVKDRIETVKPAHLIYDITYRNAVSENLKVGGIIQIFKEITLREV